MDSSRSTVETCTFCWSTRSPSSHTVKPEILLEMDGLHQHCKHILPEVWNVTLNFTNFFCSLNFGHHQSFVFQICQAKYLGSICGREKAQFKWLERCQDKSLRSQMDTLGRAIMASVISNWILYVRREKMMISSTSSTPSLQINAHK